MREFGWGTRLELGGTAPGVSAITTTVDLREDDDRVDVTVRLSKEDTPSDEALYVAFPFSPALPTVHYDRQQGWVNPAVDHQPGACNDGLTTMFAVGVVGNDLAVTWVSPDVPLFTVGAVISGRWPREFEAPNTTVFSWVMRWTGLPKAQNGAHEFRYSFRPAATWDPASAARFGREVRRPLAVARHGWLDKGDIEPRALPSAGESLFHTDLPDNVVASIHGAQDGSSLIVRLQETAGLAAAARVRHPGPGVAAVVCTGAEEDRDVVAVDAHGWVGVDIVANGVVSLKLKRH